MLHKLDVLYEDQSLLVINKPAGLIVNRSDTTSHEETLQAVVEAYTKINYQFSNPKPQTPSSKAQSQEVLYPSIEETFAQRAGIAHRLDKETSGVMLIAKTPAAFGELQRQFKERIVKKTYQALAHGKIVPQTGEITVPVGRLVFNRKRFGVVAGGRDSITRYRVISNFKYQISNKKTEELTLVELYPKTGRTHQIRVHLQYIGHPIFSDELYAGRKVAREDRKVLPRVFLHAHTISFLHPTTKKEMECTAELPEELTQLLAKLRAID